MLPKSEGMRRAAHLYRDVSCITQRTGEGIPDESRDQAALSLARKVWIPMQNQKRCSS